MTAMGGKISCEVVLLVGASEREAGGEGNEGVGGVCEEGVRGRV